MTKVYFDNAATTPIHPNVVEVMKDAMLQNFGNPSSTHQFGRAAKVAIETARKNIAKYFNVSSSEIIFTSGGTESNNFVLFNAVVNLGVKRIITTKIEHSAVLNPVAYLEEKYNIEVVYLDVDNLGCIDLSQLNTCLSGSTEKTLVSLMMVNNEIGNLLPIKKIADICSEYKALFHSDTVQAIGLYELDLQNISVDFITASAHKFHGPKGVGFVFVRKNILVKPLKFGGLQEKGLRPGTENTAAILGMVEALRISFSNLEGKFTALLSLKKYCVKRLEEIFPNIKFNGLSSVYEKSSPAILNVQFPTKDNFLLFYLDLDGVAASYGSACQSGAIKTSYVLKELLKKEKLSNISIRLSFSVFNNKSEVDFLIENLKTKIQKV